MLSKKMVFTVIALTSMAALNAVAATPSVYLVSGSGCYLLKGAPILQKDVEVNHASAKLTIEVRNGCSQNLSTGFTLKINNFGWIGAGDNTRSCIPFDPSNVSSISQEQGTGITPNTVASFPMTGSGTHSNYSLQTVVSIPYNAGYPQYFPSGASKKYIINAKEVGNTASDICLDPNTPVQVTDSAK